jgi:hypothetical protein
MELLKSKIVKGIKLETFLIGESNSGSYKHKILKRKTFANGRIQESRFQGEVVKNNGEIIVKTFRAYKVR